MIIKHTSSPVIVSDDMPESKMGIDPDNSDFIASLLRDRIYTDKVLAPIREMITNAVDVNIEAGSDETVKVSLKNVDGVYTWAVRDNGLGLSEDDVRNVFGRIGSSKKRSCNKQVGMFGIGALSFFAQYDTYFINSYFNGVKISYCATLAAGEQGVNVGNLFKVSEEPTNETGLEVFADVTKDWWSFHDKTMKFVLNFLPTAKLEYTDHDGNVFVPQIPVKTFSKDGFVINAYDSDYNGLSYGHIRMGGVIYTYTYKLPSASYRYRMVIDVPIGSMTIPPSRETLDISPSNTRVLDQVNKIIEDIIKEDHKNLKLPVMGEYIGKYQKSNYHYGEWCSYNFSSFTESYQFQRFISRYGSSYGEDIKPVNGKYIIYTFPEIRTYRSWVRRLEAVIQASPDYSGYLAVWETNKFLNYVDLHKDQIDISDCIIVDVKSLGLPKLPTIPKTPKDEGPKEYAVYRHGEVNYHTPDSLHEEIDDEIYNDVDWWLNDKLTRRQLNSKTIGRCSSNFREGIKGYGQDRAFWTLNSKKMYESLLDLGFLEITSKEYEESIAAINIREALEASMRSAAEVVRSAMFRVNYLPQITNAVGKNKDKLNRLVLVKNKLMTEDSTRGRILKSLEGSYGPKFTRSDLRKIMKMKD